MAFEELKPKVTEIVSTSTISRDEKLLKICELLEQNITYYTWVGFYFANHERDIARSSRAPAPGRAWGSR